jgi:hypothetical protein
MALSGTCETNDAAVVLGISLHQLRLNVAALNCAVASCELDRDDLQSHLIGLQHRLEALENFSDECLSVSFLPLDDEDGPGTAVAS